MDLLFDRGNRRAEDVFGIPDNIVDPRLTLARALYERENWKVLAAIASAIASDAEAELRETLYLSAIAFAQRDNWAEALRRLDALRVLVTEDDEVAIIEANRAWVLSHLDRSEDGLKAADVALALSTDSEQRPRILLNRALALAGLALYPEALRVIDEAEHLAPHDADIAFDRAGYLAVLGRRAEALGVFGRALALDPSLAARAHDDRDLKVLLAHDDSAATFEGLIAAANTSAIGLDYYDWSERGDDLHN